MCVCVCPCSIVEKSLHLLFGRHGFALPWVSTFYETCTLTRTHMHVHVRTHTPFSIKCCYLVAAFSITSDVSLWSGSAIAFDSFSLAISLPLIYTHTHIHTHTHTYTFLWVFAQMKLRLVNLANGSLAPAVWIMTPFVPRLSGVVLQSKYVSDAMICWQWCLSLWRQKCPHINQCY